MQVVFYSRSILPGVPDSWKINWIYRTIILRVLPSLYRMMFMPRRGVALTVPFRS